MLENLSNYHIFLASKSPRRRELLKMLRIKFDSVVISGIKEEYPADIELEDVPEFLSRLKADAYLPSLKDRQLVITADTVVICDNKILGKPTDKKEAFEMLMSLSGKTHRVVTGVTIITKDKQVTFKTSTDVTFSTISESDAKYYIDCFSPLDKAGAYGIQEWIGCVAVEKINGSFYNVMGLPVHSLYNELKRF